MAENEIWKDEDSFPNETNSSGEPVPAVLHRDKQNILPHRGEANDSDIQLSAVLDPKNRFALVQIINQLDPGSFVKLARTSHEMCEICFHSNNICVVYNELDIHIFKRLGWNEHTVEISRGCRFSRHSRRLAFLESATNRRRVREMYPFVFACRKLTVSGPPDDNVFLNLRPIFNEMGIQTIHELSASLPVDWDSFSCLLQEFHLEEFTCFEDNGIDSNMMKLLAKSSLKKMHFQLEVPDDIIVEATVPHLVVEKTELSNRTFKALILKFVDSTEVMELSLNQLKVVLPPPYNPYFGFQSSFPFHHYNLFKTLPFNYDGPIPEERPIAFADEDPDGLHAFKILRKDGKYVHCQEYIDYNEDISNYCTLRFYISEPRTPHPVSNELPLSVDQLSLDD